VRLDEQPRAGGARAEAERLLRRARERADQTIAGLSTRRDELVQQLSLMQERVIGVAKELEDAIERPDAGDDVREIPDAEPGRPPPIPDTWAGWAEPTMRGRPEDGPPPQPQAEELFTSSETVDLSFPEIPPLDLGWDDEDD
jgi:hypothetical protein